MKRLKIILILIFSLCLIGSSQESFGRAIKNGKAKKIKTLCHPTKKIRAFNKPVTDNTVYANNNTIKGAGEFENPYLDKVLVRGIIRDKNCVPIPNASIEIW